MTAFSFKIAEMLLLQINGPFTIFTIDLLCFSLKGNSVEADKWVMVFTAALQDGTDSSAQIGANYVVLIFIVLSVELKTLFRCITVILVTEPLSDNF